MKQTEFSTLMRLMLPMMGTQLCIMGMGFVDTAMSGHYSSVDLAGVALGGVLLWPLFMLFAGVLMAVTPMVAQNDGAGTPEQSGPLVQQALLLAVCLGALLAAIVYQAHPVFNFFDIDAQAVDVARRYLQSAAWGLPGVLLYVTIRYTFEGLGHTLVPLLIAMVALIINSVLNYLLIYGVWGLPELGGEGCGWATAITMWIELAMALPFLGRPWLKRIRLLENFTGWVPSEMARIIKIGLPIGLTHLLEMMVFSVISLLVGALGVVAIAANSVAGNLNWFTFVFPMALGSAASIRVGNYVGAKDYAGAREVASLAIKVALGYAVIATLALIVGRHYLPMIYSDDQAVIALTAQALIVIALYQIFDCGQAAIIGSLRGYKDTRFPMWLSVSAYWFIALPVGWALGRGLMGVDFGLPGFYMGLGTGLLVVALISGWRLLRVSHNERMILTFSER